MITTYKNAGFSAIELLITLLIAAVFLFAGYQVYAQVMRSSADANKVAVLSIKLSERTQKAINDASSVCVPSNVNENKTELSAGQVTYTITISCPNSAIPTLKLVKVQVAYDNSSKTLQYAKYAN